MGARALAHPAPSTAAASRSTDRLSVNDEFTNARDHSRNAPAGGGSNLPDLRPHLFPRAHSFRLVPQLGARQLLRWLFLPAIGAFLFASQVAAQPMQCADRDKMEASLTTKFGEARTAYGIANNGSLMEVWGNPETGSWSVTVSSPGGLMCLLATGDSFGQIAPAPKGEPL